MMSCPVYDCDEHPEVVEVTNGFGERLPPFVMCPEHGVAPRTELWPRPVAGWVTVVPAVRRRGVLPRTGEHPVGVPEETPRWTPTRRLPCGCAVGLGVGGHDDGCLARPWGDLRISELWYRLVGVVRRLLQ